MKIIVIQIFFCLTLFCAANFNLHAQVTFGADLEPVKGALLEIKDHESTMLDSTNASTGGLVLPRVKLVHKNTLEPFIKTTDTEWINNKKKVGVEHIGLIVYNVTESSDFKTGIYIWTDSIWKPLKIAADYVFLPAFKVPWLPSGTLNLYDIYKTTFAYLPNKEAYPEYAAEQKDFYYVVTYYDNKIINSINVDDKGVMNYEINAAKDNLLPPENAYINVVMILKHTK